MAKTATLHVTEGDLQTALSGFLGAILDLPQIQAVLAPRRLPVKERIMPALVTAPEKLADVDPLAPAFPINTAKVVSRLTRKPMGGMTAVVMRPCEIRAFVELVKLKQGSTDEIVIIGMDCLGAYNNTDYFTLARDDSRGLTRRFYESVLYGNGGELDGIHPAPACRACEFPLPRGADIAIGLYGVDTKNGLWIDAGTEKGADLLGRLDLPHAPEPQGRRAAVDAVVAERITFRDRMFEETRAATDSLEKLTAYLVDCINCYNCRVACPVCYCRECVFVTDVFDHDPVQYLGWAERKGAIKMPTDTLFYHLTRLSHMSTACVGCGQCTNACPNDIPVMELFRTVADRTQKAFDYHAGMKPDVKPPLSEFREDEFPEVVGID